MSFHPLGAGFFAVYLLLLLGIGWLASRRQKTSEDFWVAGRRFPLWVLVLANVAAMMHGGAILSHIAFAAQNGGVAVTANLSYALGFAVILFFYARKLRNSGGMTLPDYMGERFESRFLRGWSAFIVASTSVVYLIGQIRVMGFILEALIGIPVFWSQLLGTLIFVLYVAMGGLLAVVWTNIAQFFLMWAGLLLLGPLVYRAVGGWTEMLAKVEQQAPGWTSIQGVNWSWGFVLSWYILVFVAYSTRLELVTKLYAARDERVARFSIPWTAFLVILFLLYGGLYLAGAARLLVWDELANPDQAFPVLVSSLAGPWLSAFALTAVASATMSTTDSLLLMSGAAVSHDLIRKCIHEPRGIRRSEQYYLGVSRATIVLVGLLAFLCSLPDVALVLEIIAYALAIVSSAFFFPLTAGLIFWKVSRRASIVSSVGGVAVTVLWTIFTFQGTGWALSVHPVLPGLIVSGVGMVLAQISTQPVSAKALRLFFPERS